MADRDGWMCSPYELLPSVKHWKSHTSADKLATFKSANKHDFFIWLFPPLFISCLFFSLGGNNFFPDGAN